MVCQHWRNASVLWNSLPLNIQSSRSVPVFRQRLKSKDIPFSEVIPGTLLWQFRFSTIFRFRGLWNSFVILATLTNSDWHRHWRLTTIKVAINDTLPLKAARRDDIAIFLGFESKLQTNPMPLHLDSAWAATLMSPILERVRWTGDGTEYWGWVKTPV